MTRGVVCPPVHDRTLGGPDVLENIEKSQVHGYRLKSVERAVCTAPAVGDTSRWELGLGKCLVVLWKTQSMCNSTSERYGH
jgi:hypothetical protein